MSINQNGNQSNANYTSQNDEQIENSNSNDTSENDVNDYGNSTVNVVIDETPEEVLNPVPNNHQPTSNKERKWRELKIQYDAEFTRAKMTAFIEKHKRKRYKMDLKLLKLEKQLGLPPSMFTKKFQRHLNIPSTDTDATNFIENNDEMMTDDSVPLIGNVVGGEDDVNQLIPPEQIKQEK